MKEMNLVSLQMDIYEPYDLYKAVIWVLRVSAIKHKLDNGQLLYNVWHIDFDRTALSFSLSPFHY